MSEMNIRVPVIPLLMRVVMPHCSVRIDLEDEAAVAALERAMQENETALFIAYRNPAARDVGPEDLCSMGTIARISQVQRNGRGVSFQADGLYAAKIDEVLQKWPFMVCDAVVYTDVPELEKVEREAISDAIKAVIIKYVRTDVVFNSVAARILNDSDSLEKLAGNTAVEMLTDWENKQTLLEIRDYKTFTTELLKMLNLNYEAILLRKEIEQKVRVRLEKNQRDYVLREEMKQLREELGEDVLSEADEMEEQIRHLRAPAVVKEKLKKELARYRNAAPNSAESTVYHNYIETALEIPWSRKSTDNKDFEKAERILREDHYGLEKVKDRILEYLAVRMLSKKGDTPILCLVGPPGTGKTSIGRSVARALGKKYVRMSLGGVHDEAEIRGHRKTYIGAMPGRIATSLRQAGVRNPVMVLDEIDKVGMDYNKGDTFSALLEVLDSEQNVNFRDNYLELPLDLSDVFFIATANTTHTIPRPLLDRMEIIEINSYTQNEKFHIAREHLIDKQIAANGLKPRQFTLTDKGLESIIIHYTREAGVRGLERSIGDCCRKAARMILQNGRKTVHVTDRNIDKFLGPKKYEIDPAGERSEVGVVRGLAWTSVGGETLSVEASTMPGKGKFELTGQMGDVMKESAMAGISYIRSMSSAYGISASFFDEHDIHIHIPEGAVPKDGPSAGITMTTAMLSAITGIPVKADIAMTGEITLRGRILPIGGLREKTIAARTAGIRIVIVPEKNRRDIKELDKEITKGMSFVYARTMKDVLQAALKKMPEPVDTAQAAGQES